MSVITLISDWNTADFYIGAIKGKITNSCPETRIIDISHNIPPFDILKAAFILRNSYKHFPQGSIHIICVRTDTDKKHGYIAAFADNHIFITADNGIMSLIFENPYEIEVYAIGNEETGMPQSKITTLLIFRWKGT